MLLLLVWQINQNFPHLLDLWCTGTQKDPGESRLQALPRGQRCLLGEGTFSPGGLTWMDTVQDGKQLTRKFRAESQLVT